MDTEQRPASTGIPYPETELAALFAVASLINGNWPKASTADCVFVPGLAVDNWQDNETDDGILKTAAALHVESVMKGGACIIAIPGYEATMPEGREGIPSTTGYPGANVWKAELRGMCIMDTATALYACDAVGRDGNSWNTRTEADDFVRLARERAWKSAAVLCTPFHLLRVLCTLVQALDEVSYRLRLFPVTPRSISWTKPVYHSQGLKQLPRIEHIKEEWERIPLYRKNGSVASFLNVLSYLRWSLGTI